MTPGHTDTANAAAAPASAVAPRDRCALGALFALVALIVLAVAWERWLAPLRPGGSALVLKALPLVCALPGVWRRKLYTLHWASMLVLLYLAEGIVRHHNPASHFGELECRRSALRASKTEAVTPIETPPSPVSTTPA